MQDGKEELIPATDENELRIPIGPEVSCRVLDTYFCALAEKKLSPKALITGIEYPLEGEGDGSALDKGHREWAGTL